MVKLFSNCQGLPINDWTWPLDLPPIANVFLINKCGGNVENHWRKWGHWSNWVSVNVWLFPVSVGL